eukprot:12423963-Alexandrium_andersonii.AAC.1
MACARCTSSWLRGSLCASRTCGCRCPGRRYADRGVPRSCMSCARGDGGTVSYTHLTLPTICSV